MTGTKGVEVLIIGSGAGGAVTALELASAGRNVVVLEEGLWHGAEDYGANGVEALGSLYRGRGMTPILGRVPIGYVEGKCVGGSTEINSGFWHRSPRDVLLRWKSQFDLADASSDELAPDFAWAEKHLGVALSGRALPASSEAMRRGAEAMEWSAAEAPRTAPGCRSNNTCASGCPNGAKQGMSISLIPMAERAGAKILSGCRATLLVRRGRRVTGALVESQTERGERQLIRIDADHVFVCAGPTETPALLRRSGIKYRVGDSLRVHPMLKVAAKFPGDMHAESSVLPLIQVKAFAPDMHLGGAFFSKGHLAMTLAENWNTVGDRIDDVEQMAIYYVAVKGVGRGSVRPSLWGHSDTVLRYELAFEDQLNLSRGLARLATLLLAAGAEAVYPAVRGLPKIARELDAIRWMDERLPKSAMNLTTVHAFSSCPIGERVDRTAADSFGKVRGHTNLYINDASMLPDSPGVNPQGSVMAIARRNARHFHEALS